MLPKAAVLTLVLLFIATIFSHPQRMEPLPFGSPSPLHGLPGTAGEAESGRPLGTL